MTAREADEHSLWEFAAAVRGWIAANCPDPKPQAPTAREHDALMAKHA